MVTEVRQASPETFTIEVEVDQPVHSFLPGQGRSTRVIRFAVGKDVTASVWKTTQLPDPNFFPPGTGGYQGGDYDVDGNLIIWMWSEGATLRDQTVNEEYSEFLGFRVAQDGTSKPPSSTSFLARYRPSTSNAETRLLCRIFWALGRPWADGLGDTLSEEFNADGTCRVRTAGWWAGTSGSGVCELLIEPANRYLVRRASFGGEGGPPRAECRSEGSRRFGDWTFAERGEFVLATETISVRLMSFAPVFDQDVAEEARKVISRAQTRTVQVLDHRRDPGHPTLRLVEPGDLDKDE
jgi:hypothetical protein